MKQSSFVRHAAGVVALLLMLAGRPLQAQHEHAMPTSPATPLKLIVGSVEGPPDGEVEVPISLKGATGIGPAQMVLTFDPKILEAKPPEKGPLLTSNATLDYYTEPGSGRLALNWVAQEALVGDGVVVKTRFRVLGQGGQKTRLEMVRARAWDRKTHLEALVTTEPGEVSVVHTNSKWLWIAAGVGAVLLSVLLMAARRKAPVATSPAGLPQDVGARFICSKCGKPLAPGAGFCSHCGQKVAPA